MVAGRPVRLTPSTIYSATKGVTDVTGYLGCEKRGFSKRALSLSDWHGSLQLAESEGGAVALKTVPGAVLAGTIPEPELVT